MRMAAAFLLVLVFLSGQPAGQAPAPAGPPMDLSKLQTCVPLGPPANLKPSAAPDLSGAWLRTGGLQSVSAVDTGGKMRGKEPDIPYQPWALQKMMAEVPDPTWWGDSNVPFMQSPWNCSVRDNDAFTETLLNDAVPK